MATIQSGPHSGPCNNQMVSVGFAGWTLLKVDMI